LQNGSVRRVGDNDAQVLSSLCQQAMPHLGLQVRAERKASHQQHLHMGSIHATLIDGVMQIRLSASHHAELTPRCNGGSQLLHGQVLDGLHWLREDGGQSAAAQHDLCAHTSLLIAQSVLVSRTHVTEVQRWGHRHATSGRMEHAASVRQWISSSYSALEAHLNTALLEVLLKPHLTLSHLQAATDGGEAGWGGFWSL
jgi:hypothetical protein